MTIRLLIADDNARVRESLAHLLSGDVIDVLEADTCQQAICLASRPDVDAVLLDINLPDGSGLDALARIKCERPSLPVLIHSESSRPSYVSKSQTLGAAAYMVKGVDKDELLKAIHVALCSKSISANEQFSAIDDVHDS